MPSHSEKTDHKPEEISQIQVIRQAVRETICKADRRCTQLDIERSLSRHYRCTRKTVRSAIKTLVSERELMYVSDFGHTFIEASLHKPIRITASIILKPWACTVEQNPGDIVVSLCHGSSFGSGQHPTTRLCLKGLEYLQQNTSDLWRGEKTNALDIGTGTGVLIITAIKMGVAAGIGVDIDPCAISEASDNVAHNGLSERIMISSQPFETVEGSFNLILANLRFPSLKSFLPHMVDRLASDGRILISGIKSEELDSFIKHRQALGLNREWLGEERGWVASVCH